jgi:hypothetical protein
VTKKPARRFLAPNAKAGNGHGYYSQPQRPLADSDGITDADQLADEAARVSERSRLCDEPEAPGPAIVDAQADLARHYDYLRHLADVEQREMARRHLSMEARMAEANRRARLQRIDVSREMRACQVMLERSRKGCQTRNDGLDTCVCDRCNPPAAVRKLASVEARLDHRPDLNRAA